MSMSGSAFPIFSSIGLPPPSLEIPPSLPESSSSFLHISLSSTVTFSPYSELMESTIVFLCFNMSIGNGSNEASFIPVSDEFKASRFAFQFAFKPISLRQLAFKYCSNSISVLRFEAIEALSLCVFKPSKKAFSAMTDNSPSISFLR